MSAKHTPGPWVVAATADDLIVVGRQKIASTYEAPGDVWGSANARLIAAAPELLELAYRYLSDLRFPPQGDSLQRRIERARDVILKAKGGEA